MNIEKLLQSVLTKEKKERVGKVDMTLANEIKENKKKFLMAKAEVEEKINAAVKQLRDEFEPIMEKLDAEKTDIWEKIYDELKVAEGDRGKRYSIDAASGIVTLITTESLLDEKDEKPLN